MQITRRDGKTSRHVSDNSRIPTESVVAVRRGEQPGAVMTYRYANEPGFVDMHGG